MLGGWEGYCLGTVDRVTPDEEDEDYEEVWIELLPRASRVKICSGCGQGVERVHDCQERWIRDLFILGTTIWLCVHRCRVKCPSCGPKLEQLAWLDHYSRVTRRLAESVARMCKILPLKHVAEYFDLHWSNLFDAFEVHRPEVLLQIRFVDRFHRVRRAIATPP